MRSLSRYAPFTGHLWTAATTALILSVGLWFFQKALRGQPPRGRRKQGSEFPVLTDLIGCTPLVKLRSLSELTECEILAKAEFLNPGGSLKDRAALSIIQQAEQNGQLRKGGCVEEGTVGSTGIALSWIANARGYRTRIYMPNDQSPEKSAALKALGASVVQVPPVSIADAAHYVNRAALAAEGGVRDTVFANQFETLANFQAHFEGTGPEIWLDVRQDLDAFVMGAGTGGTLSGIARYLKSQDPSILVVLSDVQGSGLYGRIKHGSMFNVTEAEGRRHRHQVDSIVEGIGNNRITANFSMTFRMEGDEQDGITSVIDDAMLVTDQQAVNMSRFLVRYEGLWVGPSSAVHLVAAVRVAKRLGPGKRVVTVLCDRGDRYLSTFWSDDVMQAKGFDTTAPEYTLGFCDE